MNASLDNTLVSGFRAMKHKFDLTREIKLAFVATYFANRSKLNSRLSRLLSITIARSFAKYAHCGYQISDIPSKRSTTPISFVYI